MREIIKLLASDLEKLKFFLASIDVKCVKNNEKCDIENKQYKEE